MICHLVTLAGFVSLIRSFSSFHQEKPRFATFSRGFFNDEFRVLPWLLPTVVLFLDFAVFKSESWWSGLLILYSHLGLVTILEIWLGEKRQRQKASMIFICILFLWKNSMRKKTKNASWTFRKCQPSSQLLFFPQRLQPRVTSEVQSIDSGSTQVLDKRWPCSSIFGLSMWTSLKSGVWCFFEPKKQASTERNISTYPTWGKKENRHLLQKRCLWKGAESKISQTPPKNSWSPCFGGLERWRNRLGRLKCLARLRDFRQMDKHLKGEIQPHLPHNSHCHMWDMLHVRYVSHPLIPNVPTLPPSAWSQS